MKKQSAEHIEVLPGMICLASERKETDKTLRQAVRDLQGAYRGLVGIAELAPVSTDLKDITPEWMRGKIDKRIELVRNDMSLTEDERSTRLNAWSSLRARATRYINVIARVLSAWPNAAWKFDETIGNFYCTNIDEVAEAIATHQTPEEARTHWKMVRECIEKIREFRAWEATHDVVGVRLADLQCLTPGLFSEMWLTGGFKFDRRTAEKYGDTVGNHHEPERVFI